MALDGNLPMGGGMPERYLLPQGIDPMIITSKMNNVGVIQVGVTKPTEWNRQQYRVYSPSGLSPCLNTVPGGAWNPK